MVSTSVSELAIKLHTFYENRNASKSNFVISPFTTFVILSFLLLGAGKKLVEKLKQLLSLDDKNVDWIAAEVRILLDNIKSSDVNVCAAIKYFLHEDKQLQPGFRHLALRYFDASCLTYYPGINGNSLKNYLDKFIAVFTQSSIYDSKIDIFPNSMFGCIGVSSFLGKLDCDFAEDNTVECEFRNNFGITESAKMMYTENILVLIGFHDIFMRIILPFVDNRYTLEFITLTTDSTIDNIEVIHEAILNDFKFNEKFQMIQCKRALRIPQIKIRDYFDLEKFVTEHVGEIKLTKIFSGTTNFNVCETLKQICVVELQETIVGHKKSCYEGFSQTQRLMSMARPFTFNIRFAVNPYSRKNILLFSGAVYSTKDNN